MLILFTRNFGDTVTSHAQQHHLKDWTQLTQMENYCGMLHYLSL